MNSKLVWQDPQAFENKLAQYAEVIGAANEFIEKCAEHGITISQEMFQEYMRINSVEVILRHLPATAAANKPRWEITNYHNALRFTIRFTDVKSELLMIRSGKCELATSAIETILSDFQLSIESPQQEQAYKLCQALQVTYAKLTTLIQDSGYSVDLLNEMLLPDERAGISINWSSLKHLK